MYTVVEIQSTGESVAIPAPASFVDINDAYAKYHTVLSASAKSEVPKHGCYILDDTGCKVASQFFEHQFIEDK